MTHSHLSLEPFIDHALGLGATEADIKYGAQENLTYGQRMGQAESIERANSIGLTIRLYKGKKKQSISTNHFNEAHIKDLISETLETIDHLPEDPYCGLASPDQILQGEIPNLSLSDPYEPSEEELIHLIDSAEKASLKEGAVNNTRGAKISWSRNRYHHISSNGFNNSYEKTHSSFYLQPIAQSEQGMQIAHDYTHSLFFNDLRDPEDVGLTAARKAANKLNPKRVKTGQYPVIFHHDISSSLLELFMSAISGSNIARGVSFLKNSLHEKICDYPLTLKDTPHLQKGLGSKPFDSEGFALSELTFLKEGVLSHWNLGLTAARQLDLLNNPKFPVRGTGSTTNLHLEAGQQSLEDMMRDKNEGLLIDNIMSHPNSLVNGDYSVGASGFYFKGGDIQYPVNEITISGNLKDMLKAMIPASDLSRESSTIAPSLFVGTMSVGGL